MAETGVVQGGSRLPNQAQPSGIPGSRFTAYLRATPPIFTVVTPGNSNADFVVRAYASPVTPQRRPVSRFYTGSGEPDPHLGQFSLGLTFGIVTTGAITSNRVVLPLTFGISTRAVSPETGEYPSLLYDVAFASQPLSATPAWSDVSGRIRGLSTTRGRSYEFDRTETGTAASIISNRDAALSPANTASPFYPLKATRPVRAQLFWDGTTYPLFRGISEGYPQAYPAMGKDAVVEQRSADPFYALNRARFIPGSTTLSAPLSIVAANTEETVTVASTALPMPQAVPFEITLDEDTVAQETATVTAILNATQYTVTRSSTPQEHSIGAAVTTLAVSFGEELSGVRIQRVLERVGFDSSWYDLDAGQSIMAPSEDLASVSPLEHINLITEAEFGRFFVSRAGLFTFRDRHSIVLDFLSPVVTFADETLVVGSEIPYVINGALEHSEEKLYNRVKITMPSGQVVDISDQASIDEHFERVFEREWPYANVNDADSAARFILDRQSVHSLRLPQITVHPASNASTLWPLVLAREIGERCRFRYQPEGGGDELDQEVIIEGISHSIAPRRHAVSFQLTEADPNDYWILGTAGYSELGETTWAAF